MTDTNRIRCDHVFKRGPRLGAVCGGPIYRGVSDTKCHQHVVKVKKPPTTSTSSQTQEISEDAPLSVENIHIEEVPMDNHTEEPILPELPELNSIEDFHRASKKIKERVETVKNKKTAEKKKKKGGLNLSKIGRVFYVSSVSLAEDLSKMLTNKLDGYTAQVSGDEEIMECVDEIIKDLYTTYLSEEAQNDPYTKLAILMMVQAMAVYTKNSSRVSSDEEVKRAREYLAQEHAKLQQERERVEQVRAEVEQQIDIQLERSRAAQPVEPEVVSPMPEYAAAEPEGEIPERPRTPLPGIVVEGEETPAKLIRKRQEDEPIDLGQFQWGSGWKK